MVFTDPPYGTTDLVWDEKIDLSVMFENIEGNCKDNSAILISSAQPFTTDLINARRKTFRYEFIFVKTQVSGFLNANKAPLRVHENIVCFYKNLPAFNRIETKITNPVGLGRTRKLVESRSGIYHAQYGDAVYTEKGTRCPQDVLFFSNWNGALFGDTKNTIDHPTHKPVELVAYLIQLYSKEGEIVLDIFGGSGTTLIAAEQTGRRCYMMEIDPHYCDVIIARWEKETGKTAQLINGGEKSRQN